MSNSSSALNVTDSAGTSLMYVSDSGNVGIGTTSPNYDLEVNGDIQADNYYSGDGTQGVTADVPVAKVGGGTRTLHFKDGLYTGYTDS